MSTKKHEVPKYYCLACWPTQEARRPDW